MSKPLQIVSPIRGGQPIVDKSGGPSPAFIRAFNQHFPNVQVVYQKAAAAQETASAAVPQSRKINTTSPIEGGGALSADLTLSHATSGATAGTYGDGTHVAQLTVDNKGHVTSAVAVAISATGTVTTTGSPASGNLTKFSGASSITNGDLSGDVTTSGTLATTIAAGAVTLAKMANMATSSLIYRKTAGTGAPEVQTLATLKTDLGLTGTNSGDQTITLTGDVTGSGTGSFAATLATSGVTAGTYGDSTHTLTATVDAKGRITAISTNAISAGGSGTVTTTGSPASGNLAKFSGATSIVNGDLSGDVTTSGTLATTLAASGVTAATYGDATHVPQIAVDAKGRITSASNVAITAGGGSGGLIGVQIFTSGSAATYTPTSGTGSIVIEMVGGGGGGAGVPTNSASQGSRGASGGGGAYLRKRLTANFSGATYTVGAKGSGGAAGLNNGSDGGDTTFTDTAGSPTTYTAGKGFGGPALAGSAAPSITTSVGAGGAATNGDLNIPGGAALASFILTSTGAGTSGNGGTSLFSTGGGGVVHNVANSGVAGNSAGGYGGGGSAAMVQGTGTAQAGGDGSAGVIIIWEYHS